MRNRSSINAADTHPMSRAFTLLTAIGSAATFAGVWVATAPAPPPVALATSEPVLPNAAVPAPRKPIAAVVQQPESHVVRDSIGSTSAPQVRRVVSAGAGYYSNCNEARAAGVAPIYRGQSGYREGMDGDGDGIACEPIRN
ncbi:excalibur calcium-binding domain-containing protein [Sphingomonas sp. PB2P19]|uniref:excalibur calcium-binding domain-containing protein n=1 Tax=Sphingomonas rhamnosi TaxID=3096156 RepID=UPI002FC9D24D